MLDDDHVGGGSHSHDLPFTDDGNALRLVGAFKDVIRYVIESKSFTRRYKLAVFANDKPKVRRTNTDPIWNRIHADEWKAVITAKKAEAEIDETYEREGEGILADMVRGWVDFWQHGLAPPQAILDVTREYRDDEDPVQAWLDERCDVSDANAETPFSVLSENRKAWLDANDPERKETAKALAKLLEQRGFPKGKDGTGAAIRKGIKLCTPPRTRPRSSGGARPFVWHLRPQRTPPSFSQTSTPKPVKRPSPSAKQGLRRRGGTGVHFDDADEHRTSPTIA